MPPMDPEQRWAAAERIALAADDPGRRSRSRRTLVMLIAVGLLGGSVSTIVRTVLSPGAPPSSDGPVDLAPAFWSGLALIVFGVLIALAGLVRALLTGRFPVASDRVDSPLARRQARHVRQAIRGSVAPTAAELVVVTALARQDRQSVALFLPGLIGAALVCAGATAAFADVPSIAWACGLALAGTIAGATWYLLRIALPASRFLARRP